MTLSIIKILNNKKKHTHTPYIQWNIIENTF